LSVHDQAHALARAIKGTPEFKNFLKVKETLDKDKHAKEMLSDFRKAQWELQKQKMTGLDVSPEQEKRISQLLEVISLNLLVKEFLEAEYRFSIMVTDIQKIIGEAMEPLLSSELLDEFQDQPPEPATKEGQAAIQEKETS
jgi:cell fate (sporulation/competence/biofilm development) regulator YlbF (YheA/YmcA/DUF963 family)